MSDLQIELAFVEALRSGKICVHPTDTIPGLTCDPQNKDLLAVINRLKQRPDSKNFVNLTSNLEKAQRFWQPLPPSWRTFLGLHWPSPLTIVWKASKIAPEGLVSSQRELALRIPDLPNAHSWFKKVLDLWEFPLPSTSINTSSNPPLTEEAAIKEFCQNQLNIFLPDKVHDALSGRSLGSTIVRILNGDTFEVIREGAFSINPLKETFIHV